MQKNEIKFISKGLPKNVEYNGQVYCSSIWKEQVEEIHVGLERITGDDVANHVNHGGADRVVCFYPFEHYDYWEKEFGHSLPVAAFGENLSATNMKEDQVCIGDVYQIGDAVLQVSQGRYPCATINIRNQHNLLLKRIIETGYTGYFFRVLKEGKINANSNITKLSSHPKQVTVAQIHQLYFHEKSPTPKAIQDILALEELSENWRGYLMELIKKS